MKRTTSHGSWNFIIQRWLNSRYGNLLQKQLLYQRRKQTARKKWTTQRHRGGGDGCIVTAPLKTACLAHTAVAEQWKDHSLHLQWTPPATDARLNSYPFDGKSCLYVSQVLTRHPASSLPFQPFCISPAINIFTAQNTACPEILQLLKLMNRSFRKLPSVLLHCWPRDRNGISLACKRSAPAVREILFGQTWI